MIWIFVRAYLLMTHLEALDYYFYYIDVLEIKVSLQKMKNI